MLYGTNSVTPQMKSNESILDFESYLLCKPYLKAKDKMIVNYLVNQLIKIKKSPEVALKILDVGSGEASLIQHFSVEWELLHLNTFKVSNSLSIDCIDPCDGALSFLRKFQNKYINSNINVSLYNLDIQKYLNCSSSQYDVIFCIHCLYHICKSDWLILLKNLMKVLKPGGMLIVNLVSSKSDIYCLYEEMEPELIKLNIDRRFEECGYMYFAEDFEEYLSSLNYYKEVYNLSAPISFVDTEIRDSTSPIELYSLESNPIVTFLSFMFRIKPTDLLRIGFHKFKELLNDSKNVLTFNSNDIFFIIRR